MSTYKPITLEMLAPWGISLVDPHLLVTGADLLHMGEASMGLELVSGTLVKISPTGNIHGRTVMHINSIVYDYVKAKHLGVVYAAETGFLVQRDPDTVLAPDVSFVRSDRLLDEAEDGFLALAPDLAVEVVSPSQFKPEMAEKARLWLTAGTRLLWIIWPNARQVDVWRAGETEPVTLSADEHLQGYDVLPGFHQPVSDIFA